jgi:hypothetical protein
MAPKRRRGDDSVDNGEAAEKKEALRDALYNAVSSSVDTAFQDISAERERLLSEAKEAAAKEKDDAAKEAAEITRKARDDRAALEAEKAAMVGGCTSP